MQNSKEKRGSRMTLREWYERYEVAIGLWLLSLVVSLAIASSVGGEKPQAQGVTLKKERVTEGGPKISDINERHRRSTPASFEEIRKTLEAQFRSLTLE